MRKGKVRDSQRQKVYDSERAAFRWTYGELDPRFDVGSIEGAQAIVDAVWSSQTILDTYHMSRVADKPIVIAAHGKRQNGCYFQGTNEIHLARACGLKWYVLHEVAHALVTASPMRAAHGREWCACYLDLLRVFMGRSWSEVLAREFKNRNVQFKPKRAYTISDAERQRRAERASALRA
jgi:hypothetical protein